MSYTAPSVTASGINFATWQSDGASGHLEALIAAQAATVAPTAAPTCSATGGGSSGGLLAAGTYYFVHTESNGFGETTASPQGTQLTVSAGDEPEWTFPSLKSGNVSRNLYLGAGGGSSGGPYYLYATGITTTTYVGATAVLTNSYGTTQPPTVNTTGLTYVDSNGMTHNRRLELLRAVKDGNFEKVYEFLRQVIYDFNHGNAMSFAGAVSRFRDAHIVFAMLSELCSEAGTLLDANAGTIGNSTNVIGNATVKRTWP
jgi:hypothetical protein